MTTTYQEYTIAKHEFFAKHDFDFTTETSSMNEYESYTKTYSFTDGAQWYESMAPEYETAIAEVNKCKVKVQVKLFRTEYWDSAGKNNNRYYEQF